MPAWLSSGSLIPGLQKATFSQCPYMGGRGRDGAAAGLIGGPLFRGWRKAPYQGGRVGGGGGGEGGESARDRETEKEGGNKLSFFLS